MLEAAYRVGEDGNGKDGLVGYFKWVAMSDPRTFLGPIGIRIALLQCAERDPPERSFLTMEELNQAVRDEVGLTGKEQTKKSAVPPKSRATADWTGQDFPVGSLMQVAVASPGAFCKQLAAMLPQPPTASQRARRARRDWEQRQAWPSWPSWVHNNAGPT